MTKTQRSSADEKLIKNLQKENLVLRKKVSELINEREIRKRRVLTLRKELLKKCFQNIKLRNEIIGIQSGKTLGLLLMGFCLAN